MLRNAWMKSPLRTLFVVFALLGLLAVGAFVVRAIAARRAFERELGVLSGGAWDSQTIVEKALRVPRSSAVLGPIREALESVDFRKRSLAATVVCYWDATPRADGLLPRPEHHARPIEELLPLLPAIADAQRSEGELGEIVDACLVTVWDGETLRQCVEHEKRRPPGNESLHRLHQELVGILIDQDPRPMVKDGFSGLVYGYASDEALLARIGK